LEKIETEIKKFRGLRMAYELCICDPTFAKLSEKLFSFQMALLKLWGEYD